MTTRFSSSLRDTHIFLKDIGDVVSPTKNFNFASTPEDREWLGSTFWETIQAPIQVVQQFRYLGAAISVSGRYRAETLRDRFAAATAMLGRVCKLPVSRSHKAKIIRTKIFPAALYGSEVAQPTEKDIAKLSVAIAKTVANNTTNHDIDWIFSTASRGKDLDPIANLAARKVTMLRRAIAKRPHEAWVYKDMIQRHILLGTRGSTPYDDKTAQENGILQNCTPAPHPTRGSRTMWKPLQQPDDPIAHLMHDLYCMGA